MRSEKKTAQLEFKLDGDKREIEGYAAVFANVDQGQDVIHPGAFTKTIRERFPKGLIKVLWQHTQPLGRPLDMAEDSKGLATRSFIPPTTLGNDAMILMKEKVVDRLSIGYAAVKWDLEQRPGVPGGAVRNLREVKLFEYSPVSVAMNESATIDAVKEFGDHLSPDGIAAVLGLDPASMAALKQLGACSECKGIRLKADAQCEHCGKDAKRVPLIPAFGEKEGRVFSRANLAALTELSQTVRSIGEKIDSLMAQAKPDQPEDDSTGGDGAAAGAGDGADAGGDKSNGGAGGQDGQGASGGDPEGEKAAIQSMLDSIAELQILTKGIGLKWTFNS